MFWAIDSDLLSGYHELMCELYLHCVLSNQRIRNVFYKKRGLMKPGIIRLFITVAFLILYASSAFPQPPMIVSAAPSIYAKKIIINGEQSFEGPAIDLIKYICNDLDTSVVIKVLPWKRIEAYLENGKIDAVLTILYSTERTKYCVFTNSYDEVETSVFTKTGNKFYFETWDDLIGKQGVSIAGRMKGSKWEEFKKKNLSVYNINSLSSLLEMVRKGRADYGIEKKYSIIMEANRLGFKDEIEILAMPLATNGARIAFSKKSIYVKYVDEVNKKIAQLKADGTIAKWINNALNALEYTRG